MERKQIESPAEEVVIFTQSYFQATNDCLESLGAGSRRRRLLERRILRFMWSEGLCQMGVTLHGGRLVLDADTMRSAIGINPFWVLKCCRQLMKILRPLVDDQAW